MKISSFSVIRMDPVKIEVSSSGMVEDGVDAKPCLTNLSTNSPFKQEKILKGSSEVPNTDSAKFESLPSDVSNDSFLTSLSMESLVKEEKITTSSSEASNKEPVRMKRSSSDMAVGEVDSRPYLINLSTDSLVKQDKIIICSDEFSVGRSLDAALNIPDPFISRKHCVLEKEVAQNSEGSSWFLHQLGSSLSWINAKRIKVDEKIKLNSGDLIEFGEQRAFSFKFHAPDPEADCKRLKIKEEEEREVENLSVKLMERELEQEKMMKEKAELELKMQERIKMLEEQYQKEKEELEKKIQNENLEKQKLAEERALIEEKLAQEKLLAEQKFNNEKLHLEDKLKGLEETVKQIEEEKLRKEEARKLLEEEAERIKASLAEKEATLKKTAEQLKKDGEYEENIKKMTEELERVKEDLVQNMSKQSILEKQLKDTAGSSYLAAKTELLESFGDVIETELQCSICNELYVEAITLNCMHTFCSYCLNKWKKRKKECPVCRCKIKTENRAFIWDSFIEKMVEKLSDDLRERRRTLIAERKGTLPGTANHALTPPANTSTAPFHYINTNGMPRVSNAQAIRLAVPVNNARLLASMQPNVRLPNIPQIRLLGSIDLTQGRNVNNRIASSSSSSSTPGRSTPNILNAHRNPSSASSPSSSVSPSSRRSARLNERAERLSAKRRRLPMTESGARNEVINLDGSVAGTSRLDPPIIIEDAVIEIMDEASAPPANNSDSDSDDNLVVVPLRRRSNNSSGGRSTEHNSPQPSTSGSTSAGPSTSSGSSNSRTNTVNRKRSAGGAPIILSSSSSDSSSDSDRDSDSDGDSESSVEGYFDYEYTGGRCWECGRRGHWARACPNNN